MILKSNLIQFLGRWNLDIFMVHPSKFHHILLFKLPFSNHIQSCSHRSVCLFQTPVISPWVSHDLKAYAWQPGAGQAILAPCWLCWAYVGLCWAYVGPCGAILGAMLGPRLGHLCWNDLKMSFFPPRTPSRSPKPRKNRGFVTSPRARNTVKKDVFEHRKHKTP